MLAWASILSFLAGTFALALCAILLIKRVASPFNRAVAFVLAASGLIQLANGLGAIDPARLLEWRLAALLAGFALSVALLHVGVVGMPSSRSARWRVRIAAILAVGCACLVSLEEIFSLASAVSGTNVIAVGFWGKICYAILLLSLVVAIAQLESLLRALGEPFRYQLKFVLIGLGSIAGYQIYEASQLLLMPVGNENLILGGSVATLMSLALVGFGLGRYRLREVALDVRISPRLLYGSVTFVTVGLYLLTVGAIGQWIRISGRPLSVSVSTLVVFAGAVALVILLSSRSARGELQRFVTRHVYRSKYDYRSKWLEVTDAFRNASSVDSILDRLIQLLSRTFGAGRISLWVRFEADGRFHQVRSANTEPAPAPLGLAHRVVQSLLKTDGPVDLCRGELQTEDARAFLEATKAVLCAPLRSDEELIGFVALSRELHEAYGTDDCDLLRAITHHVGVLLSHAKMAEERRGAAEMEALHRFSAFCVHDLKNLAGRLSLVVRNSEVHGKDPAFQESAMKAVAGTARKMTELIAKLSRQSVEPARPELVNVPEVIEETLATLNGALSASVEIRGAPVPPVAIAREQLQQVLLNLVLNAKQAMDRSEGQTGDKHARIRITAERANGTVVVTVSDQGPGLDGARLRTLFQPFRTTRTEGLGIGLFECKRIIETQGGAIRVESEFGRGTTVRIELPTGG